MLIRNILSYNLEVDYKNGWPQKPYRIHYEKRKRCRLFQFQQKPLKLQGLLEWCDIRTLQAFTTKNNNSETFIEVLHHTQTRNI